MGFVCLFVCLCVTLIEISYLCFIASWPEGASERERKRESMCVRERERERKHVCV